MTIGEEIEEELARAEKKFKPMASAHEGYAVILEELDELWEEVKKKDRSITLMREEAIQVGAMAARFVLDVCAVGTKCDECGHPHVKRCKARVWSSGDSDACDCDGS